MDVYSPTLEKVQEAVRADPTRVNRQLVPPRPANALDPISVAPLLYALYWRHDRAICLFLLRSGATVDPEYFFTTNDWVLRRHMIKTLETIPPEYISLYTKYYISAPEKERVWFTQYIETLSTSRPSVRA